MRFLNFTVDNLTAFLLVVFKRLRHYLGLSVSSLIGIISVLSLIISIPIFTDAVLSQVLRQELTDKAITNHRALFSIHTYYHDNVTYSPLDLKSVTFITTWLNQQLSQPMGLKVNAIYQEMTTEVMGWTPIKYQSTKQPFNSIDMSIMGNDVTLSKTRIVEGSWPSENPPANAKQSPIPVAVEEAFADHFFINVGDILQSTENLQIIVSGIFRPIDPNDTAWFYKPDTTFLKEVWVPLQYFNQYLPSLIERPINYVAWYAIVDDQSVRFNNSISYSHNLTRLDAGLHGLLNDIKIDYTPADKMGDYETRQSSLFALFYVAGAPLVLLALLFISLTSSIAIQQEEAETATLRGRGVSIYQVYIINLIESLILVLVALPISLGLGWLLAVLMGKTSIFLQFTRHSDLAFSINDINRLWIGLLAFVIIAARLSPLLSIRHTTAVSHKQERSRSNRKPLWERFYLDFLLMVPAGYAYYVLSGKAKLPTLLANLQSSSTQNQYDPLMFIASSFFAVSACMIMLRLFPFFMRLLAWISDHLSQVGTYLAIQEITRRAREHFSIMLLIMISISLAIFSASIAKTLDQWMHDSQYYQVGADLVIKEYEIPIASNPAQNGVSPTPAPNNALQGVESLIDLEKHLQVPGIQSATFVGKYDGTCYTGTIKVDCMLMGIDRLSFPSTGYYRSDFARQSLGSLMNALAANPKGVLVDQSMLKNTGLRVGDQLNVSSSIGMLSQGFAGTMVIVGVFNYFPTVYPGDKPTVVVNLGTLFGSQEAATGYDVWINIKSNSNTTVVVQDLSKLALKDQLLIDIRGDALTQIQKLVNQPEWIGLFGILSIGFLLSGLMACIGFVLDSFASLRLHYIQLGILQAVGLSTRQMISYLVLERVLLMIISLGCGTLTGFLTSLLFMPLLQINGAQGNPIPPFEVLIGWAQSTWLILLFGLVLLVAVIATIAYLVQIKIFQAVKMGETI
jgi:putative ABC transport system permease protein